MRGFGVESTDEQWVELRLTSSGVSTLVLLQRDLVGWEDQWRSDPWLAGTTHRPMLDRDAWEAIAPIVAEAFNRALGLWHDGDTVPRLRPRTWSVTSATPMRHDFGLALAELFLAIRRIGHRPAYSYGTGQAAYDAHRDDLAAYEAAASREASEWARTLPGRLGREAVDGG